MNTSDRSLASFFIMAGEDECDFKFVGVLRLFLIMTKSSPS